ncbi:histamine H2 receptor-like [Antedon mediterranea]|uniref:histamine H2 receptor-like n=1 Tax=Antedon mediterranea TaxID=105859 RepID=UPI003AF588BF
MNSTDIESSATVTTIRTLILCIIMLLTIIGNSFTLAMIYLNESLHTKTYIFVVNLAIADLLNGLLIVPIMFTASVSGEWPFVLWFCQVSGVITAQLCLTSIATLCAIALERYHSIINPLVYESKMSNTNVVILLSWTWVQPFIFSMLPILGWGSYVYVPFIFTCVTPWGENPTFTIALFLSCMFIPYAVTVKIYYHIGRLTFRQLKQVNLTNSVPKSTTNDSSRLKAEFKSALVFAIVLGTFTICWFPYQIIMVCQLSNATLPNWFLTVAAWLAVLNSSCNPIIYCLMNRQFRNGFRKCMRQLGLRST